MPTDPTMETLLAKLQSQPNVTPEQVANLRFTLERAVTVDDAMKAVVAEDRLKGFELDFPGTPYNRTGFYEPERGVVTLPAQSLGAPDGSGFDPNDLAAILGIQRMMIDFSAKDGVTPEVIENLQESIDRSPWLSGQMKMAANGPVLMGLAQPEAIGMPLRGFEVLPESAGEGASYSSYSQTIRLKLESLQRYPGRFNENDVTFLFAHEVKHHLTERESSSAKIELNQALQAVSEGPPPHDYTAPIAAYIQARAHDEAAATIAGYNALRSAVLEQHGSVDLREMYMANDGRMVDFIHADENANSYTPLPGLSFNSDLSLSETRGNIEAMAHYYFYKNLPEGYGLGHHHDADYTHVTAASAVSLALAWERDYAQKHGVEPAAHFNMRELGVNERSLERVGIWLGNGVSPDTRDPYYDSSRQPPARHHFDHSYETHEYVPIMAPGMATRKHEREETESLEPERVPLRPDQPEHPHHALFCQIRAHIHAQYAQHGRAPDETSERMTMSLYAQAREVGITRADHVVFSQPNEEKGVKQNEYIFVVQGKMDDPGMMRAMLPLQQAANTPVEESLERVRQIEQRQQQEALAQQQTQQKDSPTQDDPSQGGPKLVR